MWLLTASIMHDTLYPVLHILVELPRHKLIYYSFIDNYSILDITIRMEGNLICTNVPVFIQFKLGGKQMKIIVT